MISGRGLNQFSPLRGTRSSSGETYISHKWTNTKEVRMNHARMVKDGEN